MGLSTSERIHASDARACDLYVDLDGTLLRTDILVESACRYITRTPLGIFGLIAAFLSRGRCGVKTLLARKVAIAPESLPYEQDLLEHLRQRRAADKRNILITASHRRHALRVARHVGLFDAAYGSSARANLKGIDKLERIRALCGQEGTFAYAGDSRADAPIWRAAEHQVFVNAPNRAIREAERVGSAGLTIRSRPPVWRAFLREMRLHQWAKNALLFVPLLTSHTYAEPLRLLLCLAAFLCFGLCASGHYFLNDLLDLEADRAHERKRTRPLASGDLPLLWGAIGAVVLPVAGFGLSAVLLPWRFTAVLGGYFILTNLYSFYFKRVSTADVVVLALLYTARVIAGAAAISVVLSSWLLAFSMFAFVSLAYLKRYIEVAALAEKAGKAGGRGYSFTDTETMFVLGIANVTAAIVVLAFYISSAEVRRLYREPEVLWLLCLLMLYWSNRIWVGARRGKIHDDPVVFAIKDRVSRIVGLIAVATVLAARVLP